MYRRLSPPQRLLLVNTRERNGSGSAGERKRERGGQPPRTAGAFFPRRDCRRPLRRREYRRSDLLRKIGDVQKTPNK